MATNSIRRTRHSCKVPVVKEAAALGTAIAAGVGAGIYSSMEETAEQFVQGKYI